MTVEHAAAPDMTCAAEGAAVAGNAACEDAVVGILRALLAHLDQAGCAYALIHAPKDLAAATQSDVDIAFDRDPNEVLVPFLADLCASGEVRLVQRLHYEIRHGYYYILAVGDASPRFLHIDCLYDASGLNRYYLPTTYLLEGARYADGAMRARPTRTAVYLAMKRAIKGNASPSALEQLRASFADSQTVSWPDMEYWFGPDAKRLMSRVLAARTLSEADRALSELRRHADHRARRRFPLRRLAAFPLSVARKVRRFVQPTGLFVVLVGPDGAGKSTIADALTARLSRGFRHVWRFHWRPGLLPKLSRRGPPTDAVHAFADSPPEASRYHGIVSLARFLYYWLDFVVGYWTTVYPRKARTTLVIGERYFPDVVVHPERYGFAVPRWLIRAAASCVPSPDEVILLADLPSQIHARKAELPVRVVSTQLQRYEEEVRRWGRATVLDGASGADAVAGFAARLILDACYRRTRERLRDVSADPWRAFASRSAPKLWVGPRDTVANALELYHPYSRTGLGMKALFRALPARIARRCLPRADPFTGAALHRLDAAVRAAADAPQGATSFSSGTPGAHRKLTAQLSVAGRPVAYGKIASTDRTRALVQREAETLEWLQRTPIQGVSLPQPIARRRIGQHELLLCSAPPPHAARERPLEHDAADAAFIAALASFASPRAIDVSVVFADLRFDARLARLRELDPAAAATLEEARKSVVAILAGPGVRVALCHGDYAPWNTLDVAGTLHVFDWEYSSRHAPLLTDLYHRVFMPARLVRKCSPAATAGALLAVGDDPIWRPVIATVGVEPNALPAYLLLYLVRVALHEAALARRPSDFVIDTLQHSLARLRRNNERRRVLVVAYACEPDGGSEPGVGWNMCKAISRHHDAFVVTRSNNRQPIECELARRPDAHLHFSYADLPGWARAWKRGSRGIRLYYYLWQFAALAKALRIVRHARPDLAHHVTFTNSYVFSLAALLPLPFVWGPIGTNPPYPAALMSSWRDRVKEAARRTMQSALRIADPLYWLCASRAKVIVGIDKGLKASFPLSLIGEGKFVRHTAIGVERTELPVRRTRESTVRVLAMGRLIPIKGFALAIAAFAGVAAARNDVGMTIIGDGPERRALERLARELGISDRIHFSGWLARDEALTRMAEADIFLFPSVEGAGMVVLEAMACGLPVVCLDYGGPGEMVTSECGIAVPVGTRDETVKRLTEALLALCDDPRLRDRLGAAGRRRVEAHYLWSNRHAAVRDWYAAALAGSPRAIAAHPLEKT